MTDDILMVYFSLTFLSPTIVVGTGRRGRRAQCKGESNIFRQLYRLKYVISVYCILQHAYQSVHLHTYEIIIYFILLLLYSYVVWCIPKRIREVWRNPKP